MHVAEWIRAGTARDCAKETHDVAQTVDQRAVNPMDDLQRLRMLCKRNRAVRNVPLQYRGPGHTTARIPNHKHTLELEQRGH